MQLLGSDTSPFVRKVRVALEEKRVPYQYVVDRPSDPGSRVAQFNPLGKIPVLVLDDGRAIYDSPVIVEYADVIGGDPALIPREFADRFEVKRWEALGDGITDATVAVSHDYRKPARERQNEAWYRKHSLKIERGLARMAQDVGEREFCFGTRFSLADIAAGYALAYLDAVWREIDWRAAHPNLKRLAERLYQRDSFRKTAHPAR